MTQNEFAALCAQATVDPALALEDEELREALRNRDDEQVRKIIFENF